MDFQTGAVQGSVIWNGFCCVLTRQGANMVVDGRSRHELYRRLEEILGPEAATTLIEHLPPVGWADVATRHDLANLEERMDLRFARVDERFNMIDQRFVMIDQRFVDLDVRLTAIIQGSAAETRASFEHELRGQISTVMFGIMGVVLTMAALAFALVRFS